MAYIINGVIIGVVGWPISLETWPYPGACLLVITGLAQRLYRN